MANRDISFLLQVDNSPRKVFKAIQNVPARWNGQVEGQTGQVNDIFTSWYKDLHYSRQQVIELVPEKN